MELYSIQPPAECAARFARYVKPKSFWAIMSCSKDKPLVGKVTESSLRLRVNASHNPFPQVLVATLQPHGKGTRVAGRFVWHPLAWIMMVFAVILCSLSIRWGASQGLAQVLPGTGVLVLFPFYGWWAARAERRGMRRLLLISLKIRGD